MHKRGQFFLIAAVIIVFVLIGFGAIYSSTKTLKEDVIFYDLSKEAVFEGTKVLDYSSFNSIPDSEVYAMVKNLTDYYSTLRPETDFIFIYGNASDLYRIDSPKSVNSGFVSVAGADTLTYSRVAMNENSKKDPKKIPVETGQKKVEVDLPHGTNVTITLTSGQNFYIFASKEREGERLVSTK